MTKKLLDKGNGIIEHKSFNFILHTEEVWIWIQKSQPGWVKRVRSLKKEKSSWLSNFVYHYHHETNIVHGFEFEYGIARCDDCGKVLPEPEKAHKIVKSLRLLI